jgi:hypothetical protein
MKELNVSVVAMSSARKYQIVGTTEPFDKAWAAGLRRTIGDLPRGATAALIGDTPGPGFDVPSCLSDHINDVRSCEPRRPIAVDEHHLAVERSVAQDAGSVFIDPTNWICNQDPCPVIRGAVLIYRDGDHMTTVFSKSLEPLLARALSRVGVDYARRATPGA